MMMTMMMMMTFLGPFSHHDLNKSFIFRVDRTVEAAPS